MNEPSFELEFLWQHDSCCVINKPGGVLTQAPPGIDSIEWRLRQHRLTSTSGQQDYVGVPHRLDRPVSGAMVFGWTRSMTRKLAAQFESRRVVKKYWALVAGQVPEDRGVWEDTMRKIPDEAKSEIVSADHPDGQHARLFFEVKGRSENMTWLEIQLDTGRTHQIRLQASSRARPILGDALYGSSQNFGPETNDERARWIALHSRYLEFDGPQTKERIAIQAPVPQAWSTFARQFDFSDK
jgi:RluA family pseudouridine synthase